MAIHTGNLTSPCYNRIPVDGENTLYELPLTGKLNIRGDVADLKFIKVVRQILDLDLPTAPNSLSEVGSNILFWLGPDEWLLHCDLNEVETVASKLRSGFGDMHTAITDVSDYTTTLRLCGPDTEALLRNGCPLDLHHSVFKPGDIAQTRFGHASILLHKLKDEQSWDIQVRWTFAEYVWDYLVSGMTTIEGHIH